MQMQMLFSFSFFTYRKHAEPFVWNTKRAAKKGREREKKNDS
jgi:hypothetical protein